MDFINPLLGRGAFAGKALAAARHAAGLAARLRPRGVPVIYANDHFGNWHADFSALLEACRTGRGCAPRILEAITPAPRDYVVLKPRHSAFYGTPLEFLLEELKIRRLIVAGLETDICILCAAQDAYMRRFELWVPRNCVASRSARRQAAALEFIGTNLKADTRPASR